MTSSSATRSSIVSEWELVCDKSSSAKMTMSAFMTGVMIGAFVMGKFADNYGRRTCLMVTTLGIIVFNTVSAVAPNYKLYLLTKLVVGFFQAQTFHHNICRGTSMTQGVRSDANCSNAKVCHRLTEGTLNCMKSEGKK